VTVVGGRTLDLSAGQGLEVPRGLVHCRWNVTDAPTRVHWISTPAQRTDEWFTGLAALAAQAEESGRELDRLAFARHAIAYRDTIRLAPGGRPLIGSIAIALMAAAGRLTGHRPPRSVSL
jgi:hypothetical protein